MQIKTFQPTDHKIKAVVYGASWSGKTVFGWTAPKPIFASAEGGLLSIAEKNPAFVEIKSLKDLSDLLDYLKNQKHDFETVIIDSISEINDIIKQEIERKTWRSMQIQDWGDLWKKIRSILRGFRDLPMHTLFIAQESNEKDEDKIEKIVPSLNGKAATEIAYFMDIVGYLFIEKATGDRKMITSPNAKLLTKDRSNTIWNDTEPDFSVWVEKVKWIKIGEQSIVAEHETPTEEEKPAAPKKPLPQPKKTDAKSADKKPMITENTAKELFTVWNEMWWLYMEKLPEDKDQAGSLKYTAEKNDPTRKKTMETLFQVDSSTKLTEEQAKELIKRTRSKIAELKKLPTPEQTEEAADESEAEMPVEETPTEEAPATEVEQPESEEVSPEEPEAEESAEQTEEAVEPAFWQ